MKIKPLKNNLSQRKRWTDCPTRQLSRGQGACETRRTQLHTRCRGGFVHAGLLFVSIIQRGEPRSQSPFQKQFFPEKLKNFPCYLTSHKTHLRAGISGTSLPPWGEEFPCSCSFWIPSREVLPSKLPIRVSWLRDARDHFRGQNLKDDYKQMLVKGSEARK